ncbi:MAG: carotenoid biosynthesis protein [Verrucomicrobiota bacterium]
MKKKRSIIINRAKRWTLVIFVIWACVGFAKLGLKIEPSTVEAWGIGNWAWIGWIEAFFLWCMSIGDFVFICLATALIGFAAADKIGWRRTWISAGIIMGFSAMLETIGTLTSFPFGAYHYTNQFGPLIGGTLPWAIPMAWFIIIVGLHLILSYWFWARNVWSMALIVAALAVMIDWIMEPFAYGVRGYWQWYIGYPPPANYCTWFFASLLLDRASPLPLKTSGGTDWLCETVLIMMLLTFIIGRIAYGV